MVDFCRKIFVSTVLAGTFVVPTFVNAQVFTDPATGERTTPPAVREDASSAFQGLPLIYGDIASVHGYNLRLESGLSVVLSAQTVMNSFGPPLRHGERVAMRGYYHVDRESRLPSFYARSIVVVPPGS